MDVAATAAENGWFTVVRGHYLDQFSFFVDNGNFPHAGGEKHVFAHSDLRTKWYFADTVAATYNTKFLGAGEHAVKFLVIDYRLAVDAEDQFVLELLQGAFSNKVLDDLIDFIWRN